MTPLLLTLAALLAFALLAPPAGGLIDRHRARAGRTRP